jgi:transcription antitermination factor NusG
MDWHIALAQPNHEKTASAHLQRLRYRVYYPVIPRRRMQYGKETNYFRPMFPRYLFVQLGANRDWYRLETAPGVQVTNSLLALERGRYATITPDEMTAVIETAKALNLQMFEPKNRHGFKLGDEVKIKVGPFADFLATIDALDDDERHVGLIAYLLGRQVKIPRVKPDHLSAA